MPSRLSWLALGIGAYLAFALTQFPASSAVRWFVPSSVRLAGIEGTIWSGSASLGSIGELALRDLRWQLDLGQLLFLKIGASFEGRLADGFFNGRLTADGGRIEFDSVQAGTSIEGLAGLLPGDESRGQISVNLEQLVVEQAWPVSALGEVRIGRLEVSPLIPVAGVDLISLGNYAVRFQETNENWIAASVRDQDGPLELVGTLRLNRDRSYLFEGQLRARPSAQPVLVQGLAYVTGEPDADGWRDFEFPGSL